MVNLLVILVIVLRPYMRSITNVYMISLCLADFIYLGNLTLVAATQINEKSWPFGRVLCTLYHGTETTGKSHLVSKKETSKELTLVKYLQIKHFLRKIRVRFIRGVVSSGSIVSIKYLKKSSFNPFLIKSPISTINTFFPN